MKNALFILSLVLAGCSGLPTEPGDTDDVRQPGAVQLQAERTSTTTILLTLRNGSGSTIGYNLCTTSMEQRTGAGWRVVPSDGACTLELRTLGTGDRATYTRQVPADLAAGEYRFVTQIESPLGSRQERIVSNPVTIP